MRCFHNTNGICLSMPLCQLGRGSLGYYSFKNARWTWPRHNHKCHVQRIDLKHSQGCHIVGSISCLKMMNMTEARSLQPWWYIGLGSGKTAKIDAWPHKNCFLVHVKVHFLLDVHHLTSSCSCQISLYGVLSRLALVMMDAGVRGWWYKRL